MGRGSRSVTAGGGRARQGVAPAPSPTGCSCRALPTGAPRCRVAPGTPVGERGVSRTGGPRSCLCPRGGRRLPGPWARARALLRPPAPVGKFTLGGRLGSLTQIRHDKGSAGDWCGGTRLGGAKEGVAADGADPRICPPALRSPTGRCAAVEGEVGAARRRSPGCSAAPAHRPAPARPGEQPRAGCGGSLVEAAPIGAFGGP